MKLKLQKYERPIYVPKGSLFSTELKKRGKKSKNILSNPEVLDELEKLGMIKNE